ncbi:unnamed protein product [Brassica rapa subsp. trilocularis]
MWSWSQKIGCSMCQVADAYPLIDLAGEVTGSRDTSIHAVCVYVLMSGESERGAWKWQSTLLRDRNLVLDDIAFTAIYFVSDREKRDVKKKRRMGRIFTVELEGRSYRCRFCRTHLALPNDLISKSFHCRREKAYLFNRSVNISMGPLEERMMLSGMHTVADIFCCCCGQNVGWKYESAHEKDQKYKEGKFVLERGRIMDETSTEVCIDTRSDTEDS